MPLPGVSSFGGGVVLVEHPDAGRTDELREAQGFDLGARGAAVLAPSQSDCVNATDPAPASFTRVWGIASGSISGIAEGNVVAVGCTQPLAGTAVQPYGDEFNPTAATPTIVARHVWDEFVVAAKIAHVQGLLMTAVSVPYYSTIAPNPLLVCLGTREGVAPRSGYGLAALSAIAATLRFHGLNRFDGLGTGSSSEEGVVGTHGKHLYFRGIAAYSGHVFGYGFDDRDAGSGYGRNRLMFSNLARPLKWGNDDQATSGDRSYTDSDALEIGGAGETIRAAYAWNERLWIATNSRLHWVQGYGRQTFQTDGVTSKLRLGVTGPYGMTEGPDGALYLLTPQGLVRFDGSTPDEVWRALRTPSGRSPGWWDLIWYDTDGTSAGATDFYYPGSTNQDLAWLASDLAARQVWVVIPYCNATTGAGRGDDTVVLKFHVDTGGWTRQVFLGRCYTAGTILPRSATAPATTLLGQGARTVSGTVGVLGTVVERFAYRSTGTSEIAPTTTGELTMGDYAFAGPAGVAVTRKVYVTVGWPSVAALPIAFTCAFRVDEQLVDTVKVTIASVAPVAPSAGDVWLDTSGTDAVLGVGTAGALVGAAADYVLKTYRASAWHHMPGAGQIGTRVTIPVPFLPRRGARLRVTLTHVSASERYRVEGLSFRPTSITEGA